MNRVTEICEANAAAFQENHSVSIHSAMYYAAIMNRS